jgi:hypothetical protein
MSDPHSYRDGFREGVVFLLVDSEQRVLLECRPDKNGKFTDIFYPSGSIEVKDHTDGRTDYREVALYREIGEEFRDGVTIGRIQHLGDVKVPEIGLVFYVYWIESWSGSPGDHTYEDGAPFGELRWTPLDEVRHLSPYDSTARMTKMLREAIMPVHDTSPHSQ